MIMCDGASRNKGVIICTDNFTIQEVVLIMNILIIKFRLNCTIHMDNGYPRIYINQKSMVTLIKLIDPFFIQSMRYKLYGRVSALS